MLVPADVDLLLLSTPATSRSIISETLVTSLLVLLLVDTSENVSITVSTRFTRTSASVITFNILFFINFPPDMYLIYADYVYSKIL